jgi:hypothetical protein
MSCAGLFIFTTTTNKIIFAAGTCVPTNASSWLEK